MNIVNKAFLKLVLLPSAAYQRIGVNIPQLKAILHTKLMMDDRRAGTLQQVSRKRRNKPVSMATIGTMLISAIMGLFFLVSFIIGNDMVTQLTIYFSFFFFMLSASMITDFTSVLIDVRDNYVILPKPVNDRTFVIARLLHIFIHVCKMVVPMALPGLVSIIINYGVTGGLLLIIMILCVTLFSLFFINAVYLLILRITTPQKFQAIIGYFQIVFAILIYSSYQIIPRMLDIKQINELDLNTYTISRFFPMYWFAELWHVLYTLHGSLLETGLGLAGLSLPVVSMLLVVKYLAPSFSRKLALIGSTGSPENSQQKTGSGVKVQGPYSTLLSKIFTRSHAERMGFLFTWKMTARSRDFRMKVYPSIGYLVVYVILSFFSGIKVNSEDLTSGNGRFRLLVISALYITSLLLTMAIGQISFSDQYKASWFYYTSPLKKPGEVILGGAKAAIFRFYFPAVILITASGLFLIGPSILPNIILGLFNELLIATLLVYTSQKFFPFSQQQTTQQKTGSFLRNMGIFMVSGLIAFGHFLIFQVTAAVILCAILSILATWLLMSGIRDLTWEAIKSSYRED